MITGYGLSTYDLSSMEKYGNEPAVESRENMASSSQSQVVGLQSMFKAHRREAVASFN